MRVDLALTAAIGAIGALALHVAGCRLRQQAQQHQPLDSAAQEPAAPEEAEEPEPAPQPDVVLRAAAEHGENAAVRRLLADAPAAALVPDARSRLPLHLACLNRHAAAAGMLVAAAPRTASALDGASHTPLFLAARAGDTAIVAALLSAAPAAATVRCNGSLPIHSAAAAGHTAVVQQLMEAAPGTASVANGDGSTPLQLALGRRHISTARCLLASGPASAVLRALGAAGEPALPLRERKIRAAYQFFLYTLCRPGALPPAAVGGGVGAGADALPRPGPCAARRNGPLHPAGSPAGGAPVGG